jgi:hypothetical protein
MEVWIYFCHHKWWLRLLKWWFADKIVGIRNIISKSSYGFEIHFREIMTGVILTTESRG